MCVGSGAGVGMGIAVGIAPIAGVAADASTVMILVVVHATEPMRVNAAIPTINRRQLIIDLFKKIRVDSYDQDLRAGAVENDDLITV
jgi:hypothetical protein